MPMGLILGLVVVVILYMLIQLVAMAAVPNLAESTTPLLDTASNLFGEFGAYFLMVGVATSVIANLISSMFSATRVTYALSLEKFPPSLVWQGPQSLSYTRQFSPIFRNSSLYPSGHGFFPVLGGHDSLIPAFPIYHDLCSRTGIATQIPWARKVYPKRRLSNSNFRDFVLPLADDAGKLGISLDDRNICLTWNGTLLDWKATGR